MNVDDFIDQIQPSDRVEQTDEITNGLKENPAPAQGASTDSKITPQVLSGTNLRSPAALLDLDESEQFRTRWNEIQGKFVDEPREAVKQADALVTEVVEKLTRMFADEHGSLELQWNQGIDVSTEDLRKALQHYRTFFNRLVV